MKTVTLKDKSFSLCIHQAEIRKAVTKLAEKINRDYQGRRPVFLVILNGSFVFAADLLREIDLSCEITFVKLSSYAGTGSTGEVKNLIGLDVSLNNRDVVILEDIIDSGITMEYLLNTLKTHLPASVSVVTLLLKPDALVREVKADYVGISIPNDFIVGYGLDYDGLGRNLSDIYKIIP